MTLTPTEARKAVRWFKKAMGLQDWRIRVWVQNEPPSWCEADCVPGQLGRAFIQCAWKTASVWVSDSRSRAAGEAPLATLFHELSHVAWKDIGGGEDQAHMEFFLNRLGKVLATAYKHDHRLPTI